MFDYRRFWSISCAYKHGGLVVHVLGDMPPGHELLRGETTPTAPLRFHHSRGGRRYDFIGASELIEIVSTKVVEVLQRHEFTGWTTYPVEIYDKNGHIVSDYHGLAVTGRSGPVDPQLSPVMTVPSSVAGGKAMPHRIGYRFWPETWDGTDLFSPDGTMLVFAVQEVRDALVSAKATNVELRRITEIEHLAGPWESSE